MLAHPDTDPQPTYRTSTAEGLGKAAQALTVFPVWRAQLPPHWPGWLGKSVITVWAETQSLLETC